MYKFLKIIYIIHYNFYKIFTQSIYKKFLQYEKKKVKYNSLANTIVLLFIIDLNYFHIISK